MKESSFAWVLTVSSTVDGSDSRHESLRSWLGVRRRGGRGMERRELALPPGFDGLGATAS